MYSNRFKEHVVADYKALQMNTELYYGLIGFVYHGGCIVDFALAATCNTLTFTFNFEERQNI